MLKANEQYHWIGWTLHLPFAKISIGHLCLLENDDTISVALIVSLVI